MTALIVSLNFNPGHFSHLVASYKLFTEIGFAPLLYVHPGFNKMDEQGACKIVNNMQGLGKKKIAVAIFWFPSLKNIWTIIRLRLIHRSKVIYVLHEPFDSIANYRRGGFGWIKVGKIVLINLVNKIIISLCHHIILPSDAAYAAYRSSGSKPEHSYSRVPLLFDDEAAEIRKEEKKFISYIGTVAEDHAFDKYLAFAFKALEQSWFPQACFLIATKSAVPMDIKEKFALYLRQGDMIIQDGLPMTNSQINAYYTRSLVIWNAYNRTMQSGVLPKAFMFGTPVISAAQNPNEFVEQGANGLYVADNGDTVALHQAVKTIVTDLQHFSNNARHTFLTVFYYRNYLSQFKKLIQNG